MPEEGCQEGPADTEGEEGLYLVEFLSPCPTILRLDAKGVEKFLNEQMEKEFPLKQFRDRSNEADPIVRRPSDFTKASLDRIFGIASDSAPGASPDLTFTAKNVG